MNIFDEEIMTIDELNNVVKSKYILLFIKKINDKPL